MDSAVDAVTVAELLAGTMLAGREIETVPVSGGNALVIECAADDRFEAWTVCREILEQSQRWPIFACEWVEGTVAERLREGVPPVSYTHLTLPTTPYV